MEEVDSRIKVGDLRKAIAGALTFINITLAIICHFIS